MHQFKTGEKPEKTKLIVPQRKKN